MENDRSRNAKIKVVNVEGIYIMHMSYIIQKTGSFHFVRIFRFDFLLSFEQHADIRSGGAESFLSVYEN